MIYNEPFVNCLVKVRDGVFDTEDIHQLCREGAGDGAKGGGQISSRFWVAYLEAQVVVAPSYINRHMMQTNINNGSDGLLTIEGDVHWEPNHDQVPHQ